MDETNDQYNKHRCQQCDNPFYSVLPAKTMEAKFGTDGIIKDLFAGSLVPEAAYRIEVFPVNAHGLTGPMLRREWRLPGETVPLLVSAASHTGAVPQQECELGDFVTLADGSCGSLRIAFNFTLNTQKKGRAAAQTAARKALRPGH